MALFGLAGPAARGSARPHAGERVAGRGACGKPEPARVAAEGPPARTRGAGGRLANGAPSHAIGAVWASRGPRAGRTDRERFRPRRVRASRRPLHRRRPQPGGPALPHRHRHGLRARRQPAARAPGAGRHPAHLSDPGRLHLGHAGADGDERARRARGAKLAAGRCACGPAGGLHADADGRPRRGPARAAGCSSCPEASVSCWPRATGSPPAGMRSIS